MTKEEFRKLAGSGLILLDGATGSNLQKRGMPTGVCPDEWILSHPEVIGALQTEYLEAGSRILYSPTFSCNRIKLAEFSLEERIGEMNRGLVQLSRKTIDRFEAEHPEAPKAYVAGDVSMTGIQVKPVGPMEFEELVDIYREQIRYLAEGGADLIVVETMMSLQETRAALLAAREVCELPVITTMTFEADGRSLFGTDIKTALITLQSLGADAFGANCSTGPEKMLPLFRSIAPYARIPLVCKPNAGLPSLDEKGNTVYDMPPETFCAEMEGIIRTGITFAGGCCGTDPDYIRELNENYVNHSAGDETTGNTGCKSYVVDIKLESGKPSEEAEASETSLPRCLTSERQTLEFTTDGPFLIIGERINPTGKKKLQEELRNGSFEMVRDFASQQELRGASILDVNMGMSGVDEKEMILKAIDVVTQETSLPLCIDTSYPEIMETALRHYPGRALMNSVSAESDRCDRMLEIAQKYGAMFILLPLGDAGLPKTTEEKKENIRIVYEKALKRGFRKEDIIVDGLVGTVGAVKSAALDTLETIRYCRSLGLATACGLSNISFGLPERIHVNTAFLTMAIREGLTMAICNPNTPEIISAALSADLLMNKDGADIRYIEYMNEHGQELRSAGAAGKTEAESRNASGNGEPQKEVPFPEIRNAVLRGKKDSIEALTERVLQSGADAGDVLNEALIPAINEVGTYFDQGKYFLPQLIASAESMELSVKVLEPHLQGGAGNPEAGSIVIATVEGDVHDIGKNLVTLMLKNYGFRVTDLGKNVSRETIVETAIRNKADIICLSALMTTTMKEMKQVIAYAKEQGCRAKFMIGGAVITEEYRKEIGADGYAADAASAVKVAKQLMQMEGV